MNDPIAAKAGAANEQARIEPEACKRVRLKPDTTSDARLEPDTAQVRLKPDTAGGDPGGRRWVRTTACDNIPPREGRAALVGGCKIALFNLGDRVLAVDNRCPHGGGPLSDGIVAGDAVVCPLHAWKVSLETGAVQRPSGVAACVATYATRVEAGVVLVELPLAVAPAAGAEREGLDRPRADGAVPNAWDSNAAAAFGVPGWNKGP